MERSLTDPASDRVALLIAYDGRTFSGWQVQPRDRTIQGTVEEALASLVKQPIRITGAGRTDAGVSAWGQVAHADLPLHFSVPRDRLANLLNRTLPPEIRILESASTGPDFHARHSARRKIYRYAFRWLPETISRHPGDRPFSAPVHRPFVMEPVLRVSQVFLGANDFRHFTVSASCPGDSVRPITGIFWEQTSDGAAFWISGPGFLHKMVRTIGGYLRDVATGARTGEDLPELLKSGSPPPRRPIEPLPPEGLSLVRVFYDDIDPFDPRNRN